MIINTIPTPPSGSGTTIIQKNISFKWDDWSYNNGVMWLDYKDSDMEAKDVIILTPCADILEFGSDGDLLKSNYDSISELHIYAQSVTYDDVTIEDGIITICGILPSSGDPTDIPTMKFTLVIIKNS